MGALDPTSTGLAFEKPIGDDQATIAPEALRAIIERTKGYPFFLQEWASVEWNNPEGSEITLADADRSHAETLELLDRGFFKVRIDRLTKTEIQFVRAMAALANGPYEMADIALAMKWTQQSSRPMRASIITKGVIYSSDHGYLDFVVALFAEFIWRQV